MKRPWIVSLIAAYSGIVAVLSFGDSVEFLLDDSIPACVSVVQLAPALVMFLFVFGLWFGL